MMGLATVLTKRWGRPPGMNAIGFTGWTFLLGGLTLLPFTLAFEGLPARPDRPQHRRPGLPGADQRHHRVRAVVLGSAAPAGQLGHLPQPAQPGGRRRARAGWCWTSGSTAGRSSARSIVLVSVVLGQQSSAPPDRTVALEAIRGRVDVSDRADAPDRRWPRSVYGTGSEPDPRFTLRQRTHLPRLDPHRPRLPRRRRGHRRGRPADAGLTLEIRVASLLLMVCGLVCGDRRLQPLGGATNGRCATGHPLPSSAAAAGPGRGAGRRRRDRAGRRQPRRGEPARTDGPRDPGTPGCRTSGPGLAWQRTLLSGLACGLLVARLLASVYPGLALVVGVAGVARHRDLGRPRDPAGSGATPRAARRPADRGRPQPAADHARCSCSPRMRCPGLRAAGLTRTLRRSPARAGGRRRCRSGARSRAPR